VFGTSNFGHLDQHKEVATAWWFHLCDATRASRTWTEMILKYPKDQKSVIRST